MRLHRAPNQYTQVGAGAIPRLVTDKAGEIVHAQDYNAKGNNSNDDGPALNAMFDAFSSGTTGVSPDGSPTPLFRIPKGIYLISEPLRFPNGTFIDGDGSWNTIIRAAPGFTGIMLQDKGNASKINIRGVELDTNNEGGVTDILNLGNITNQWGTGGFIEDIFFRGGAANIAAGTVGFRMSANIDYIRKCEVWECASGFIEEAGSIGTMYSNIGITDITDYGIYMHHGSITSMEIESPADSSVAWYVLRSGWAGYIMYSQMESAVNDHIVEIDAGAYGFNYGFIEHVRRGSGPTLSVLNHVIEDNRANFPLHWGDNGDRPVMSTGVSDQLHVGSKDFTFRGQLHQNFILRITNNAGTIQHSIGAAGDVTSTGAYNGKIVGSTATPNNTPTGADASTAMVAGGKISSVSTNAFIFNTADQASSAYPPIQVSVVYNNTTTPVTVQPAISSRNVNGSGTPFRRLELFFYNSATGASFGLGTGNIGAGTFIDVLVTTYLK